jgi:hypothetical protein
VEHGEEADPGSQMPRVRRDGRQSLGRDLEQNVVDHPLVLKSERSNLFRDGENNVKVRHLEEFRLAVLDPLRARQALALRAVAVTAAVERIAFIATLIAAFEVAAERCRPALLNGSHDAPLRDGHRRAMLLTISYAVAAEDIRHFQLRAIHTPATQKC